MTRDCSSNISVRWGHPDRARYHRLLDQRLEQHRRPGLLQARLEPRLHRRCYRLPVQEARPCARPQHRSCSRCEYDRCGRMTSLTAARLSVAGKHQVNFLESLS